MSPNKNRLTNYLIPALVLVTNLTYSQIIQNYQQLRPQKNDAPVQFVSLLSNNSIGCISLIGRTFTSNTKISVSVTYKNALVVGGLFNRINGKPCSNPLMIRHDSIFAFVDKSKGSMIQLGKVHELKVYKETLYAATENGLWKFDGIEWTAPRNEEGNLEILQQDKNQICADRYPTITDLAEFNDKLYLIYESGPVGYCPFFYKTLIEYDGSKFRYGKEYAGKLPAKARNLSIAEAPDGLYISSDSAVHRLDDQSVTTITRLNKPLNLFSWKNAVFGMEFTGNDGSFKVAGGLHKFESGQYSRYLLSGTDADITNVAIHGEDLYVNFNRGQQLQGSHELVGNIYQVRNNQVIKLPVSNCNRCAILLHNEKPITIRYDYDNCEY